MLPNPDPIQLSLINAGLEERRVIVAGPGAGKTTTGIHLVLAAAKQYANQEKVVLYLSFSRAAMSVAFKSFEEASIQSIDILAMTLDSLAWQITEAGETPQEGTPRFEEVVNSASSRLDTHYQGEFDDVVHLIVDEAQDLSKSRRKLLCAIIECLPAEAGVSIFGDPLQAIYDFNNESNDIGESGWNLLLRSLAERHVTKTYTLSGSHRALRRGPRSVSKVSEFLRGLNWGEREGVLDDLVSEFSSWDLDEFVKKAAGWKGSTAVLVRTNAEALLMFGELSKRGIPCTWSEPGRSRPRVKPWVAELWEFVNGGPVTYSEFVEFAKGRSDIEPSVFSQLLRECEPAETVVWDRLGLGLQRASDPTAPWFVDQGAGFTISTIHQSKGLEWDNVAVVRPGDLLLDVGHRSQEHELLFVSLSRARYRIVGIDWLAPYMQRSRRDGMVYSREFGTRQLLQVGVTPSAVGLDRVGSQVNQSALLSGGPNYQVQFELLSSGYSEAPIYRCRVGEDAVGITTEEFGKGLAALYSRNESVWPALGPVIADGLETVFSYLPDLRFWLKPRPFGMATVINS